VLEEYTYTGSTDPGLKQSLSDWEKHLKDLAGLKDDPVWRLLPGRLVIVPDGIFSFYVQSACEVAQHVAIVDETVLPRKAHCSTRRIARPKRSFAASLPHKRSTASRSREMTALWPSWRN
jgi:hypothetical protein